MCGVYRQVGPVQPTDVACVHNILLFQNTCVNVFCYCSINNNNSKRKRKETCIWEIIIKINKLNSAL